MNTKKANYKLVGYTYRYSVRQVNRIGGIIRPETGQLKSIHLRNVENDNDVVLSDQINPGVFEKTIALIKEHFDYSTSLKMDIVTALNDITFTFNVDKLELYQPKDSEILILCDAKAGLTEAEWLRIIRLTDLDAAGAFLTPKADR